VSELSHLFAPIEVGRMTVKNRVVMAPMERNYANLDGTVSERTRAHYEARARGGVGWIDVEATYVDPVGRGRAFQLGIDRDECVEGFRELVNAAHAHGAKIGIELQHSGRCTSHAISGSQPVAPSPVPEPVAGGDVPRELTVEEIQAIIARHGEAARRAAEAGFDAVELHSAHGYLPFAFLSPMTNHRTDEYGGSFENRLRLSLELVEAFRGKRAGPRYDRVPLHRGRVPGGWNRARRRRAVRASAGAGRRRVPERQRRRLCNLVADDPGDGLLAGLADSTA
jgi:2,4-dienoyl-CoA reductase-like NADH-dependent reductase (Old Yellow Enzyme family)